MRAHHWLLLLLLIASPSQAQSQGGCGEGHIMVPQEYYDQASGTRQMRLQCIYGSSPEAAQLPPARRWLDRWGAISIDDVVSLEARGRHGLGTVRNRYTKRQARRDAIGLCQEHGGDRDRCRKNLIVYKNACAVVVASDTKRLFMEAASSEDAAWTYADRKCQRSGAKTCGFYLEWCAPPFYLD